MKEVEKNIWRNKNKEWRKKEEEQQKKSTTEGSWKHAKEEEVPECLRQREEGIGWKWKAYILGTMRGNQAFVMR